MNSRSTMFDNLTLVTSETTAKWLSGLELEFQRLLDEARDGIRGELQDNANALVDRVANLQDRHVEVATQQVQMAEDRLQAMIRESVAASEEGRKRLEMNLQELAKGSQSNDRKLLTEIESLVDFAQKLTQSVDSQKDTLAHIEARVEHLEHRLTSSQQQLNSIMAVVSKPWWRRIIGG